jgi:hypothetical protein
LRLNDHAHIAHLLDEMIHGQNRAGRRLTKPQHRTIDNSSTFSARYKKKQFTNDGRS